MMVPLSDNQTKAHLDKQPFLFTDVYYQKKQTDIDRLLTMSQPYQSHV
jgi:hypothetical protein